MSKNTFRKEERLKSRKQIAKVFEEGRSFSAYPIRVQYLLYPSDAPQVKATFVVPKRSFKKAVDRNRIKRQMKEAYRLQKSSLIDDSLSGHYSIDLVYIYLPRDFKDYNYISQGVEKVLKRIIMMTI